METLKHKIAVLLAKYFIRSSRGRQLRARFTDPIRDLLDGTVYLFALKGIFGFEINAKYLIYIVTFLIIWDYFVAWIDETRGFWKIENAYTTSNLNPFNATLMNRIEHIEKIVVASQTECNSKNKDDS